MNIGFGIASTSDATITINSGDSVQVNMAIQLRIAGLDCARAGGYCMMQDARVG